MGQHVFEYKEGDRIDDHRVQPSWFVENGQDVLPWKHRKVAHPTVKVRMDAGGYRLLAKDQLLEEERDGYTATATSDIDVELP
jgi:hypothetical protein